jgi:hypothetical protein
MHVATATLVATIGVPLSLLAADMVRTLVRRPTERLRRQ